MTRRTTAQTRQLLLDVGTRLLYERGANVGVTHIRLSDVAAAAGLTTGAAYRCWENQDAFHRDLAAAAIRFHDQPPSAETMAEIGHLVETRAPLSEVVRVAAEANLFRYPENVAFLTTVALRACSRQDETLVEASCERFAATLQSFNGMYAVLLKVYGRRVRPPLTLSDLTRSLMALNEGFALQAMSGVSHPRVKRSDCPPGVGPDWTLFAVAAEAIVERFTEPATAQIPRCSSSEAPDVEAM